MGLSIELSPAPPPFCGFSVVVLLPVDQVAQKWAFWIRLELDVLFHLPLIFNFSFQHRFCTNTPKVYLI